MAVVISVYGKSDLKQITSGEKQLASMKREVASQSSTWKKFNSVVGSVGKGLMVLGTVAIAGVAIALASMIGFIFKAKAAYEGWMKQVGEMIRLTGLASSAASRLAGQFQLSGVEAKAGGTLVYMFGKALDKARQGGATTLSAFQRLHINLKDGEGKWRSMNSVLTEARDRLSKVKDSATFAGIAAALFGKGAKAGMIWLKKSSEELKKYTGWLRQAGLLMGAKSVAQFKQYREDQKQMSILWQGFQVSAYRALVPLINEIMPTLNKAMGTAVEWMRKFTDLATKKGFTFAADKMIPGFKGLRKTLRDDLIPALKDMAGNIKDLAVALGPVAARMRELSKSKLDTSWSGNLKAVIDNFKKLNGISLAPMVAGVSQSLRLIFSTVVNVLNRTQGVVNDEWRGIKRVTGSAWASIVAAVRDAFRAILSVAITIGHAIASNVGGIWRGIQRVSATVWDSITGIVSRSFRTMLGVSSRIGHTIASTVGGIWRGIKTAARTVWDSITGIVRSAWNNIAGFVNKIIGAINTVVTQVNRLAHTSVGTIPTVPTGASSSTRGNGGAGESAASLGQRVSTPRVMDNEGMGGPLDSISSALGSAGSWIGDMIGGMGIHWPQPTGGLFGGITGALLEMVKDAVWSFVKKFGGGEGMQIIEAAKSMLGVPYLWGGTSPAGFDCSGLIYWAYMQAGKSIPRVPTNGGRQIPRSQIRPADVMFYYPGAIQHGQRVPFGHFKMYAGGGQTIESTTGGVQLRPADWAGCSQIRTYLRLGGGADGPLGGYPVMMHGRESVVAHDNPTRGLADLVRSGVVSAAQQGDTYVAVYLDSEPIAARVEVRRAQSRRRDGRLR